MKPWERLWIALRWRFRSWRVPIEYEHTCRFGDDCVMRKVSDA